jgi:hypothetical protein
MARNPKGNEYGVKPKYDVGDKVKVWPIFKNPIGVIESIVDENAFPMKFMVKYVYPDTGTTYIEPFESQDLTLIERRYVGFGCNCGTESGKHSNWCNKSKSGM